METALAELLAHAPIFIRKLNGEILYWSSGAHELYGFGFEKSVGRVSHELLRTGFPEPLESINHSLRQKGIWEGLLAHIKADGTPIWVQSRWRLKNGSDAEEPIVVESNADVTQRENLAQELNHRVKNTLAVVQGLARLTFRREVQGVKEFEERLGALSKVHDILVQHHWSAVRRYTCFGGRAAVQNRARNAGVAQGRLFCIGSSRPSWVARSSCGSRMRVWSASSMDRRRKHRRWHTWRPPRTRSCKDT
jgi:PAS domain S-box-containing protein